MKYFMVLLAVFLLFPCCDTAKQDKNREIDATYTNDNTHIIFKKEKIVQDIVEIQKEVSDYKSKANNLELISSMMFDVGLTEKPHWVALGTYYYDWRNNRVYLNPTIFIDIINMEIEEHNLSDEKYKGLRSPYSNNSIHIIDTNLAENSEESFFIYNLDNNKITTPFNDLSYNFCSYDSDRNYSHAMVATGEYTVALQNGRYYNLLAKDGRKYSGRNNENEYIINKINMEFKNSLFENEYIMDLIITINNDFSYIVTREKCSLSTTWSGEYEQDKLEHRYENTGTPDENGRLLDPAVYFLYNLARIFPENNIADELIIRTLYGNYGSIYQSLQIDIFNDGFYVYTHEKLIIMNIKNMTVSYYNIELNVGDWADALRLSPDGSKCFIFRQGRRGVGYERNIRFEVYKL